MKNKNLLFATAFFLCTCTSLWAQKKSQTAGNSRFVQQTSQEKMDCRSEVTQVAIDMESNRDQHAYRQLLQQNMGQGHRAITEYTIQIHIVRMDDGTGGINVATIRNEITNWVNPYFADVNAAFVECSPEIYHNSSQYYVLGDGSEDPDVAGNAMSAAFNVANVVNVYFVNDPDGACGWARFPWDLPADYIVIANGCADNKSTLVHELGHYFSLYHTHETAFGAENVTRNVADLICHDCDSDGDLLCDTPADPNLSGLVTAACVYTGSGSDACAVTYTPDPALIMSYSEKACRTIFTASQKAKMTLTMASPSGLPLYGRNYLQTSCPCDRPQANCKNITVNLNSAGTATITPASIDNNSTWDCGFGSWSVSPNTFDCGDVGDNTVTLTLTDAIGWVSTCQSTVSIADATDPTITTPASGMNVECDGSGNTTAFANWINDQAGAKAIDACGGTWSNNSTGLSDGCGATGSETVTFTYTDPSGNAASTTATFTIEDNTPPSLTCPADIHLPECVPTATWSINASDVCGNVTTASIPASGSTFAKGSTTIVNVTATDDCSNESNC
ncbi:MAG TPA: M43 family zinc metalloprotease, partial [Bacteroidia bacterium]|nr:M43 family zinc metalloprotease [Bacteroidia bacterium]